MAICKNESEFIASANTLLEVSRRHKTLFIVASVNVLIESKEHDSEPGLIYVLPLVWKRLIHFLRGADICYATNGDFILAISDIKTQENIRQFCERIIELLADEYHFENKTYTVKIQIGVSQYSNDAENIEEMLAHAKEAVANIESSANRLALY